LCEPLFHYKNQHTTSTTPTVVPNLFDLVTLFEILHKRSAPAITCKDVQIIINQIRNTIISHGRYTLTNNTCANQWDDWACICTANLEIPGDGFVRANRISSPASTLFLNNINEHVSGLITMQWQWT